MLDYYYKISRDHYIVCTSFNKSKLVNASVLFNYFTKKFMNPMLSVSSNSIVKPLNINIVRNGS